MKATIWAGSTLLLLLFVWVMFYQSAPIYQEKHGGKPIPAPLEVALDRAVRGEGKLPQVTPEREGFSYPVQIWVDGDDFYLRLIWGAVSNRTPRNKVAAFVSRKPVPVWMSSGIWSRPEGEMVSGLPIFGPFGSRWNADINLNSNNEFEFILVPLNPAPKQGWKVDAGRLAEFLQTRLALPERTQMQVTFVGWEDPPLEVGGRTVLTSRHVCEVGRVSVAVRASTEEKDPPFPSSLLAEVVRRSN